ncbi:hypothetical protein [Clostridium sp. KNHs214]|uniref:hypothetical protein n=1 Tax=Clostridium sp. KNHs214 TaxID=1540257 RepID=UPI000556284E|nr:hypothetical protein [Clostridium sp. KNHs214]
MKGFILDKDDDEYLKNHELKTMDKEIKKEHEFDNITIANPQNSNSIYIIKNIFIKSEINKLYLGIGSRGRKNCFGEENQEFLFFNDTIEEGEYIHLVSIDNNEEKRMELLRNKCIILLPEGFLNIKVDKPIDKINIKILWREENIE